MSGDTFPYSVESPLLRGKELQMHSERILAIFGCIIFSISKPWRGKYLRNNLQLYEITCYGSDYSMLSFLIPSLPYFILFTSNNKALSNTTLIVGSKRTNIDTIKEYQA